MEVHLGHQLTGPKEEEEEEELCQSTPPRETDVAPVQCSSSLHTLYYGAVQILVFGNLLPMETFGTRSLLTFSLAKLRQKVEVVFKAYKLFIFVEVHYISNSFFKNVLKIVTWKPGL
jgi:hypothetical protein